MDFVLSLFGWKEREAKDVPIVTSHKYRLEPRPFAVGGFSHVYNATIRRSLLSFEPTDEGKVAIKVSACSLTPKQTRKSVREAGAHQAVVAAKVKAKAEEREKKKNKKNKEETDKAVAAVISRLRKKMVVQPLKRASSVLTSRPSLVKRSSTQRRESETEKEEGAETGGRVGPLALDLDEAGEEATTLVHYVSQGEFEEKEEDETELEGVGEGGEEKGKGKEKEEEEEGREEAKSQKGEDNEEDKEEEVEVEESETLETQNEEEHVDDAEGEGVRKEEEAEFVQGGPVEAEAVTTETENGHEETGSSEGGQENKLATQEEEAGGSVPRTKSMASGMEDEEESTKARQPGLKGEFGLLAGEEEELVQEKKEEEFKAGVDERRNSEEIREGKTETGVPESLSGIKETEKRISETVLVTTAVSQEVKAEEAKDEDKEVEKVEEKGEEVKHIEEEAIEPAQKRTSLVEEGKEEKKGEEVQETEKELGEPVQTEALLVEEVKEEGVKDTEKQMGEPVQTHVPLVEGVKGEEKRGEETKEGVEKTVQAQTSLLEEGREEKKGEETVDQVRETVHTQTSLVKEGKTEEKGENLEDGVREPIQTNTLLVEEGKEELKREETEEGVREPVKMQAPLIEQGKEEEKGGETEKEVKEPFKTQPLLVGEAKEEETEEGVRETVQTQTPFVEEVKEKAADTTEAKEEEKVGEEQDSLHEQTRASALSRDSKQTLAVSNAGVVSLLQGREETNSTTGEQDEEAVERDAREGVTLENANRQLTQSTAGRASFDSTGIPPLKNQEEHNAKLQEGDGEQDVIGAPLKNVKSQVRQESALVEPGEVIAELPTVPYSMVKLEIELLQEVQDSSYIIKVLDAFRMREEGNLFFVYLVMENMKCSLDEVRYHLRPSILHMEVILRDVLRGIDFIHSKDIVHCDIKAENVLISADGEVKICDFGLATRLDENTKKVSLNKHGRKGTVQYMAPELLLPKESAGLYDGAVDLWSFGILMYFTVHGHTPFEHSETAYFSVFNWCAYQISNEEYYMMLLGPGFIHEAKKGGSRRSAKRYKKAHDALKRCLVPYPKNGPPHVRVKRADVMDRATVEELMEMDFFRHSAMVNERNSKAAIVRLLDEFVKFKEKHAQEAAAQKRLEM